MASMTMTHLIDDLDGSDADITVALTVDSKRYRVDLSNANYREYIEPLVKVARPSKVGRPTKQAPSSRGGRTSKRRNSGPTAYSKLSSRDQEALRGYLKRIRGRVSDREVADWRAAGKP